MTSHNLEIEATQLTWVVVKSDEQESNEALAAARTTYNVESRKTISDNA